MTIEAQQHDLTQRVKWLEHELLLAADTIDVLTAQNHRLITTFQQTLSEALDLLKEFQEATK